ncbi:MAG TPA: hypothetical protein VEA80_02600 [Vitreimonas sp.]|uniref:anti-sigma factor family protein n=1 Tax=Vitreimonas sp. TaxID=3069702 RepID=UPI002D653F66|nr:hypothetical protein [Vitreimonas sp.]HYD86341.1 hypothetical protein [Vitreimonas sp.]
MSVSDEELMAFADGELDAQRRAIIQAAVEADEALQRRVEAHRRMRTKLADAFSGVLSEDMPARLRAAAAGEAQSAEVVQLGARRSARWSMREWGAMGASLAAGWLIAVGLFTSTTPALKTDGDGLVASGVLSRALDTQLASDEAGAVRVGLSFRAQSGDYCRTFSLTQNDVSGLACRERQSWRVLVTAREQNAGEVRMASAPAIMDSVDQIIEGEPLDAEAERQARDRGWR